jgi:hypothetical protein
MIVLPRQARDKHWEDSKKRMAFSCRDPAWANIYGDSKNIGNLSLWYAGHASMPGETAVPFVRFYAKK